MPKDVELVQAVKENLPDVAVLFNGRRYIGHVRGRMCQFANVCIQVGNAYIDREVAWPTVARVVASNGAIRF